MIELNKARRRRAFALSEKMKHSNTTVSSSKLQFAELIKGALLYTVRCTVRASLASPFGRGGRAQRVPEGEKYPGKHLASPLGRGGRAQRGRRGQPMTIPKDNTQLENARRLRREMTPHERKLWYLFLRKYPVKIYKQRIIGRFIVDFYCASAGLVIELDGSQHYEPQGLAYDAERSQFLMSLGLEILRFSNRDIDRDFRGVCTQIDLIIRKRLQDPLSHLR